MHKWNDEHNWMARRCSTIVVITNIDHKEKPYAYAEGKHQLHIHKKTFVLGSRRKNVNIVLNHCLHNIKNLILHVQGKKS